MRFINVGFGNLIAQNRVVAIERMRQHITWQHLLENAEDMGLLIDLTYGRRISTVVQMDSGHYVLSAHPPEVILERMA